MPRIDPVQLLKCLSVLLDPNGGIKSQDEVQRLASLMTKFSKKLVSKCIYIHILKQTKTDLLGLFMGAGGWTLTHVWLTEGILAKNGALVKELLELLLVCPVDVDRLKSNNCPKLVKDLSKDDCNEDVRVLANKLVEQWLKIVKGETTVPLTLAQVSEIISPTECTDIPESNISEEQDKENCSDQIHSQNEIGNTRTNAAFEFINVNEMNEDTKEDSNEDLHSKTSESIPILKISVKDGKQVVSKIIEPISDKKQNESDNLISDNSTSDSKHKDERTKSKDKNRDKNRSSSKSSSSGKSSSSKYSKSSSDSSDKSNSSHSKIKNTSHSKSSKSNSSKELKHSDKTKDKISDKHRDKESNKHKDKDRYTDKEKDKHAEKHRDKSNSKKKDKEIDRNDRHRSSTSEKEKEVKVKEQNEKNKETLQKLQPISLNKLGKIPKRTLEEQEKEKMEFKKEKPSLSIEVRKPNDANRPKTVKMFHSKFRSHGLEEEAKRPPPRGMVKKSTSPLISPAILPPPKILSQTLKRSSPPPKRSSPPPVLDIPPEKRIKVAEHIDKPGAIKLIPPKPKPAYLLESDMFMDALTASATNKKEPKKRKRRTSGSKDGTSTSDTSPPTTPIDLNEKTGSSSAPPRFYQDTLQTEEDSKHNDNVFEIKEKQSPDIDELQKDQPEVNKEELNCKEIQSPDRPVENNPSGLKGVLLYHKRTGPKKTLRWRPEEELEEIQYFELDETERVNVTKTFMDLIHLDRVQEREAFRKARNLPNEDTMEEKMSWRPLIIVDMDATYVEYGKNSKEKDIQATREKSILPALYFHKSVIPESPFEPDIENHPTTDPMIIPLEDKGENDSINDYRNTPWPEPKVALIHPNPNGLPLPPIFPNIPQFPPGFPPNQPFGVPGFPHNPAMMGGGEWPNGPPGMMLPPEAMSMGQEMFPNNGPIFPGPMPPNGFGVIDNMNGPMFHQRFAAPMPGVPIMPIPGAPNAPFNLNANNNMGGIRNMGPRNQNPHWRPKGPGNWNGPTRGAASRRKLCAFFQSQRSCRQGDKCQFLHPGVNCPL